ncbi:MAG: M14 family zinc carboxypeptidase [Bdellovibrionota bacterium]
MMEYRLRPLLLFLISLTFSLGAVGAENVTSTVPKPSSARPADARPSSTPFPRDPKAALELWCRHLSKELRSVNYDRCFSRGWKIEASSPGGRPIPSVSWNGAEAKEEGHRVLILGAIHGDEISAVSMVFRWLDFLDRTKQDSFLRQKRFLFFPLVNPDGFFIRPRTRTNMGGVDVNRNFATKKWDDLALLYWKTKTGNDPRRYPGEKAASEIETQVVQKAIDGFKPDLIISVHAPYKLVDHDGPIQFPNMLSPLPVRTLGAFPGSLGTYAGIERNIPVVTPELPSATTLPDIKAVEQLFLFIMRSQY